MTSLFYSLIIVTYISGTVLSNDTRFSFKFIKYPDSSVALQDVYSTLTVGSAMACCSQCCQNDVCESVNYTNVTGQCQLSTVNKTHAIYDVTPMSGSVVYSKECKRDWYGFRHNCYKIIQASVADYVVAEAGCRQVGAKLTDIQDLQEQQFLKDMILQEDLSYNNWNALWVGGSQLPNEGDFVWSNNQTVAAGLEWADGNPDNGDGIEDCMDMLIDQSQFGKLNDAVCSGAGGIQGYICKIGDV